MPPERRLEDRIRALSAALATASALEMDKVLPEFYAAVHEYTRRLENKTTATVLAWPDFPQERRRTAATQSVEWSVAISGEPEISQITDKAKPPS